MAILSSNIIEALRDGGAYVFEVVVEERYVKGDLAFTRDIEQVTKTATIRLDRDDILDEDVQAQIAEFMREKHVLEIRHNSETVWTETPSRKKTLTFSWGDHLSVI